MGFLDRFKRKEQNVQQPQQSQQPELPFDVQFCMTQDGRLQVDFFDKQADFKQFYDSTRLIASMDTFDLGGKPVHNCLVSWYGKNDAVMFDENGMMGRMFDYRGVLAEIDLEQLQTDQNYCYIVMKDLLSKQRVERYLSKGLEENPDTPCGKYIGGVRKMPENQYQKFFSIQTGKACHYSDFMVNRRREVREAEEKRRQQIRAQKEAQIKKLQAELDEMR